MALLKFIKSFHTLNTYLVLASILFIVLLVYFYQVNPL